MALSAPASHPAPFTLDDRYSREEGLVYLSGIQALVRMLLDRARLGLERLVSPARCACSSSRTQPLAALAVWLRTGNAVAAASDIRMPAVKKILVGTTRARP